MVADHSWGMAARSPTPPVDTPAPALAGESSGRRERLLILVFLPLDSCAGDRITSSLPLDIIQECRSPRLGEEPKRHRTSICNPSDVTSRREQSPHGRAAQPFRSGSTVKPS